MGFKLSMKKFALIFYVGQDKGEYLTTGEVVNIRRFWKTKSGWEHNLQLGINSEFALFFSV